MPRVRLLGVPRVQSDTIAEGLGVRGTPSFAPESMRASLAVMHPGVPQKNAKLMVIPTGHRGGGGEARPVVTPRLTSLFLKHARPRVGLGGTSKNLLFLSVPVQFLAFQAAKHAFSAVHL